MKRLGPYLCIPKRHLQDRLGLNHDRTYAGGNKRIDAGAALQQVDGYYGGGQVGLNDAAWQCNC